MNAYNISSLEQYFQVYRASVEQPEAFWKPLLKNTSNGIKNGTVYWTGILHSEVKWFSGAKLNIIVNCIDRHLSNATKQQYYLA